MKIRLEPKLCLAFKNRNESGSWRIGKLRGRRVGAKEGLSEAHLDWKGKPLGKQK